MWLLEKGEERRDKARVKLAGWLTFGSSLREATVTATGPTI